MTDGTDLFTQWQQRCSTALLRAARVARTASESADEVAVVLRVSAGVDWAGRAADAYRDRTWSLLGDTAAACDAADDLAARLTALARAVEQGP